MKTMKTTLLPIDALGAALSVALSVASVACGSGSQRAVLRNRTASLPVAVVPVSATHVWDQIPFQQWAPLPGTTTGLLMPAVSKWGQNPLWNKQLPTLGGAVNESPDNQRFYFMADGQSPRALYFVIVPGEVAELQQWEPQMAKTSEPNGDGARYDVRMAGPGDPRLALPATAHLVTVEVNGGRGYRESGLHFVATDTKRVDGTQAMPLNLLATLDDAQVRWLSYVSQSAEPIAQALLSAGKDTLGQSYGTERDSVSEAFFPTWDNLTARLRIQYFRRVTRSSSLASVESPPSAGPGPLRAYHADVAMECEYDSSGHLLQINRFPVTAVSVRGNAQRHP
jgi:hypothetical protein